MNRLGLPDSCATPMKITRTDALGTFEVFRQAVAELPEEVALVAPIDIPATVAGAKVVFVATDGDDTGAGTIDAPLATLQAALDRTANGGGTVIYLRGGTYMMNEAAHVTAAHSGTADAPFVIAAYNGEKVIMTAETKIDGAAFTPVTDKSVLARLDESARAHVLQLDMRAFGITTYGDPDKSFLYVNHRMQTIARYPELGKYLYYTDAEHMNIIRFQTPSSGISGVIGKGDNLPGFTCGLPDERPLSWEWTDNIWMFGTPYEEWDKGSYPIISIDRENKTMTSSRCSSYGMRFNKNNYFYFYNILEELNRPGEWFLDHHTGILYYYPQEGFRKDDCIIHYATLDQLPSGIIAEGVSNITVSGIEFRTLYTALTFRACDGVTVQDCTVSNMGDSGILFRDCKNSGVLSSRCSYTNQPMLYFLSSNDSDLAHPDRCFVQNCFFEGTNPDTPRGGAGVFMTGIGSVVSHNEFRKTTISANGTECIYEYNLLIGGYQQSYDWGPIYVGGCCHRHGQHIRHNIFRHLTYNLYGIYLDDLSSGHFIYGNVVHYATGTPRNTRGINIHGGRENVAYNNIVIGANYLGIGSPNMYTNCRGWFSIVKSFMNYGRIFADPVYTARYPIYSAFYRDLQEFDRRYHHPSSIEDVDDVLWAWHLSSPANNLYLSNALIECGKTDEFAVFDSRCSVDEPRVGNLILHDRNAAGFADCEAGDFTLSPDSAILSGIPGFTPMKTERIGMIK